jgi:hypothetical protein
MRYPAQPLTDREASGPGHQQRSGIMLLIGCDLEGISAGVSVDPAAGAGPRSDSSEVGESVSSSTDLSR